jgi:twitching motility protein PilT
LPDEQKKVVQIDKLLDTVIDVGASDLHLTVGLPPTIRLHGHLKPLKTDILTPDSTVALMKSIAPDRAQEEIHEHGTSDFGFAYRNRSRFRVSIFRQRGNIALTLRQIPNKLLTFDQIGLPEICVELCRRPRGMFLVTGPTGSGKTTTLASMINYINETMDRHIITVEDPIEYYHPHKKSIINQREVGTDVPSFSEALRRSLRQDPDVILVGELRDLETIESAIRAAETGHLVFATLHTNSASGTINRIIDAFPVEQQNQIRTQLSTSLMAVLSQQLMARSDSGGMIAAFEFLVITSSVSNLIREGKTFRIDSVIQTGKKYGMQLLDDHLWELYSSGKITAEDMVDKAKDPDGLAEKIKKAGGNLDRTLLGDSEAEPKP